MISRRRIGITAATLSIVCLLIPLLVIQFMPFHDDEFGVNRWNYFDAQMPIAFRVLGGIGIITGCVAANTRSRRWYIPAILNAVLFVVYLFDKGGF